MPNFRVTWETRALINSWEGLGVDGLSVEQDASLINCSKLSDCISPTDFFLYLSFLRLAVVVIIIFRMGMAGFRSLKKRRTYVYGSFCSALVHGR